jgi:hypothetical protein
MHKKTVYKSTYNCSKDGNDASQTGISPVILLFCNCLHMWKGNSTTMHELNEFATFNETANYNKTKVVNCQFSNSGFLTNKSCL